MKNDDMELVRGSGNVYRDFGYPDADVRQLKSILAAQILKIIERDKLSVREAQRRTGIAAADFSRIRKVKLERFTIDRLLTIVNKLGTRFGIPNSAQKRCPRMTNGLVNEILRRSIQLRVQRNVHCCK